MSTSIFYKPDKVLMHKASDFNGTFEFSPLEKGYGITIGNSLRRVLLSSLEGYAITSVRIQGVPHEFTTINGVYQDMTEIVLNLKQVRFKSMGVDDEEKIFISISGQDTFSAADIGKASSSFMVLNPHLVICNMEPTVKLEIELVVNKGRGYVAAEEGKGKEAPIGLIPVDTIYSPIKMVRYEIENTRVGQATDFEKLIIHLETDGSVHPEEALKRAARILIQHLVLFSDENITLDSEVRTEDPVIDEKFLVMRKLLNTPLSDLDLSVRAYNCLRAAEIKSLGDLVQYEIADLLKFRNFGKKSLAELEELVKDKNLVFGMDILKYRLDEE
ncbi:MAG: DNA-directed RNA polymerase subunit alpha [Bacteroidetes bacterium]|jgi:DNA-directed RNA polymerase subunit alpha|nr:DNA-directed RNA polymerase subunit alpha [Bacteroidota bacterium]